jgi:hypothetical protein
VVHKCVVIAHACTRPAGGDHRPRCRRGRGPRRSGASSSSACHPWTRQGAADRLRCPPGLIRGLAASVTSIVDAPNGRPRPDAAGLSRRWHGGRGCSVLACIWSLVRSRAVPCCGRPRRARWVATGMPSGAATGCSRSRGPFCRIEVAVCPSRARERDRGPARGTGHGVGRPRVRAGGRARRLRRSVLGRPFGDIVRIGLSCPAPAPATCVGRLALVAPDRAAAARTRTLGATPFSIPARKTASYVSGSAALRRPPRHHVRHGGHRAAPARAPSLVVGRTVVVQLRSR